MSKRKNSTSTHYELWRPVRSDYPDEPSYASALAQSYKDYQRSLFRAIDTSPEFRSEKPVVQFQTETVHDWINRHPQLLNRYKIHGPVALLMLDDE